MKRMFELLGNLYKAEHIVEEVLMQVNPARNNDGILYCAVYDYIRPDCTLREYIEHPKRYGCPTMATIERCRRKILERRPELKNPNLDVILGEQEDLFREYARRG